MSPPTPPSDQVAAVPYRIKDGKPCFLLVCTSGGRSSFPKGHREDCMSDAESAKKEAREEAGVTGEIAPERFKSYQWTKRDGGVRIDAFLLRVTCEGLHREAKEMHRHPTWCSPTEAARRFRKNDPPDDGELEGVLDEAARLVDKNTEGGWVTLAEPSKDSTPWPLLREPAVAGMRHPQSREPDWQQLARDGYHRVLPLHDDGDYDCFPLERLDLVELEDQFNRELPTDPAHEWPLLRDAVQCVLESIRDGVGIVVHCMGGRGRTGTVLACVLREFGVSAACACKEVEMRGGHLESPWQRAVVSSWPDPPHTGTRPR